MGAMLLQPYEDKLHPVAFYSHKLTKEERNYHAHDKELLAIVKTLDEWRAYLEGAQHTVTFRMDHRNLLFFLDAHKLNPRQLQKANDRYARQFDAKHQDAPEFRIGDEVWLSGKNLALTRRGRKLDHIRQGPFCITAAVGDRSFRLDLPGHG